MAYTGKTEAEKEADNLRAALKLKQQQLDTALKARRKYTKKAAK